MRVGEEEQGRTVWVCRSEGEKEGRKRRRNVNGHKKKIAFRKKETRRKRKKMVSRM